MILSLNRGVTAKRTCIFYTYNSIENDKNIFTLYLLIPECRFIFTADPGGRLKLWKLCHNLPSSSVDGRGGYNAFLIAEYASCFGLRIMCLDASFDEEVNVFITCPCFAFWTIVIVLREILHNRNMQTSIKMGKI